MKMDDDSYSSDDIVVIEQGKMNVADFMNVD